MRKDPIQSQGSWWRSPKTGERLFVQRRQWPYRNEYVYSNYPKARYARHPFGHSPDRMACHLEGEGKFLLWLTKEEIRGAWKMHKPKTDRTYLPHWLRCPYLNDFLLKIESVDRFGRPEDKIVWVSIMDIRAGWLCLSGILEKELVSVGEEASVSASTGKIKSCPACGYGPAGSEPARTRGFDWGLQRWNTFFLPASEALPRLTPKHGSSPSTVWDRLNEEIEIECEFE